MHTSWYGQAKDDSIGFFGPIGWAEWDEQEDVITVIPGRSLLKRRRVYFEHWAIDGVARALSRDARLLPWLRPRLHPGDYVNASGLVIGGERVVPLDHNSRTLLAACDGNTSAEETARTVVARSSNGFALSEQVFASLGQLVRQRVLIWELEVPLGPHPTDAVRRQLQVLPQTLKTTLLKPLMALDGGLAICIRCKW